jgi:UDP-N-acetylmuramate dehydrogenase
MVFPQYKKNLMGCLLPPRGRLEANVILSKSTWFRVGGPAEVMFWPADVDDLAVFLENKPDDVPVTVIGTGSNLMVRDGGIPGVVIRLGKLFEGVSINDTEIWVSGGMSNLKLANIARKYGIAGFEFLCGIPGTVGGSIRMNSGAYGYEIKDILQSATAINKKGSLIDLSVSDLKYSYRNSGVGKDLIFIGGFFSGSPSSTIKIENRMKYIRKERKFTQPIKTSTGGSTFINPPGYKAWELIDAAGCRGLTIGGAVVSMKHCNFLINQGSATASDLENLGEKIRHRVYENSGINLEWEIQRIGVRIENNSGELSS